MFENVFGQLFQTERLNGSLVDDSASIRQMVSFTLKGAGYTVVEACHGQEALAKMNPAVNLVITDLNMPVLDGIGLVKGLRANPVSKYPDHCAHHRIAGFQKAGGQGRRGHP